MATQGNFCSCFCFCCCWYCFVVVFSLQFLACLSVWFLEIKTLPLYLYSCDADKISHEYLFVLFFPSAQEHATTLPTTPSWSQTVTLTATGTSGGPLCPFRSSPTSLLWGSTWLKTRTLSGRSSPSYPTRIHATSSLWPTSRTSSPWSGLSVSGPMTRIVWTLLATP